MAHRCLLDIDQTEQFGTIPTATGGVALDAQAVGAWGGVYQAGYIVALLCGG